MKNPIDVESVLDSSYTRSGCLRWLVADACGALKRHHFVELVDVLGFSHHEQHVAQPAGALVDAGQVVGDGDSVTWAYRLEVFPLAAAIQSGRIGTLDVDLGWP